MKDRTLNLTNCY